MARRTIKIPQKGSKGTDMSQVEKANDIISSLDSIQGNQNNLAPVKPSSIPKTKIVIGFAFFSIIFLGILSLGNFPQTQPKGTLAEELNFEFQLLNGMMVNLSDFAGAPIILDLMSIDCSACKAQIPELKSLSLSRPQVQIITVSVVIDLDTISRLSAYADEYDITWTLGRDIKQEGKEAFSVNLIPTMAFINAAGNQKQHHEGIVPYDTLVDWVEKG